MENTIIEILFHNYIECEASGKLEENRESAFSAIDRVIEDDNISELLIDFQYAAMKAAFYEGFSTALEMITGKRPAASSAK